jgi:hypothetical protein
MLSHNKFLDSYWGGVTTVEIPKDLSAAGPISPFLGVELSKAKFLGLFRS